MIFHGFPYMFMGFSHIYDGFSCVCTYIYREREREIYIKYEVMFFHTLHICSSISQASIGFDKISKRLHYMLIRPYQCLCISLLILMDLVGFRAAHFEQNVSQTEWVHTVSAPNSVVVVFRWGFPGRDDGSELDRKVREGTRIHFYLCSSK